MTTRRDAVTPPRMDRIFRRLQPVFLSLIKQPVGVFAGFLMISLVCLNVASRLDIDTDFSRLLPPDNPIVQALEKLRETVGGENHVAVVIQGDSFETNRTFAEALIPAAMAMRREGEPYFTRVDFRKDPSFIENHALYFATDAELDQLQEFLKAEIEQARLDANPFFFELEEDDEESEEEEPLDLEASYDEIVPKEWPISEDSTIMVIRFFPSGSKTDVGFVEDMFAELRALSDSIVASSPNPPDDVLLGGRLLQQLVEIRQITDDVRGSFAGGVGSVLLIVMIYLFFKGNRRIASRTDLKGKLTAILRMPAATLLIAIPLAMSLTWTFALAYLAFGMLNLMTSTLVLVLFGLGIDYGIHFFARYAEEREDGNSAEEALQNTFVYAGPPIAVSAATTALSLFVLVAADFRGFSQFGFIAGTGITFALIAMLTILPALIVLFDRWNFLNPSDSEPERIGMTSFRFPGARLILGFGSIAALAAAIAVPTVSFEYRFNKLEPEFNEYRDIRALEEQVYPSRGRRNPAYIILDDPAHVDEVRSILTARMEADTVSPTIRAVEALQDRYSEDPDDQARKLERLEVIRGLLADPYLEASGNEDLDRLAKAAQTRSHIAIEDVPDHLKSRFKSKGGEFGTFVTIYPDVGLSDGRNSIAFTADVGRVELADGKVYHAGSTSLVASEMLRLMLDESPWMVGITLLVVVALMFTVFGSVRWGFLATVPLLVGVLWMLGIMELFDIQLNFYNLVVLPAVLGIGNDCGVHMVHRYRDEGPGSLLVVLRSSGEHITVGVVTTMVGFSWWMFSYHPGLQTLGQVAVIGLGTVLAASLIYLTALLQVREDRTTEPSAQEVTGV